MKQRQKIPNKFGRIAACVLCCVGVRVRAQETGMLCTDTNVNPVLITLRGPSRVLLEGRRSSRVFYFVHISQPTQRTISMDARRALASFLPGLSSTSRPSDVVRSTNSNGMVTVSLVEKRADPKVLEAIADSYRKTLNEMTMQTTKHMTDVVPFLFLGGEKSLQGDVGYDPTRYDMTKVQRGYERNPSDIAALLYLEMALIENEKGKRDYWRVLEEGIEKLAMAKKDFRGDVEFRQYLPESSNFDRPECAIFYLAGECAEEQGEKAKAVERYTTLIERSPGSPLAWEACARLVRMASTGTEVKRLQELKQMLIDTYPLIWGCPREGVKLDKTTVPTAIHALLTKVADEMKK